MGSIHANNLKEFWDSYTGKMIILCTIVGVIFSLAFIIGAWYSCNSGGGILNGLECKEVKIVASCEDINGKKYDIGNNTKGIYYKEGGYYVSIEDYNNDPGRFNITPNTNR